LLSAGLLTAAAAFAQTAPAQKQRTQEGAPAYPVNCSQSFNANPAGDPSCKQQTQSVAPSPILAVEKGK
jgi:hypothetical protein